MIKKLVCCAVVGLFVFGLFAGFGKADDVKPVVQKSPAAPSPKGYTIHDPIRIDNDADFTAQFANRTIWGLDINGTSCGCCIFIGNCSLPFTVKDCYLHDADGFISDEYFRNTGLYLYNSSNGNISSNYCFNNAMYGTFVYRSDRITINNNNCSANQVFGTYIYFSNSNTVTDNCLLNNNLVMGESNKNIFHKNLMFNCSMCMGGDEMFNVTSHIIDTSNHVNGKPIYYIKNETGITIPKDMGLIYVMNCSYITIENQTHYGISLGFSTNCILEKNNCSDMGRTIGIYLLHSDCNILKFNNCSVDEGNGIVLAYSNHNIIYRNNFTNNGEGVGLTLSNSNTVVENNISYNTGGIDLVEADHNKIISNKIMQNNWGYGIKLSGSEYNRVHHNSLINNNGTSKQASDGTDKNFWNTSTDGNYWSDWCNPDNDSNGIVDFPYWLEGIGREKDCYPLTNSSLSYPWSILSAPNGGEVWDVASKHDITWLAGNGKGTLLINLGYSTTGSSGPWISIASGEANDGVYEWSVPNTPSTYCYVRVVVIDPSSPIQTEYEMSASNFTIKTSTTVPETPLPAPLIIISVILLTLVITSIRRRRA